MQLNKLIRRASSLQEQWETTDGSFSKIPMGGGQRELEGPKYWISKYWKGLKTGVGCESAEGPGRN